MARKNKRVRNKPSHKWKIFYRNRKLEVQSEEEQAKEDQFKMILKSWIVAIPLAILAFAAVVVINYYLMK